MVKIKSQGEIADNYDKGIGRAPENYKKGIQRTTDWAEKASSESAESNYAAGVARAAAGKLRQKKVAQISNEEWKSKAAGIGSTRIGQGMKAGAPKRTKNFEPYRQFIESANLPDRTTDAETNVMNRVVPLAKGMQDMKRAGT